MHGKGLGMSDKSSGGEVRLLCRGRAKQRCGLRCRASGHYWFVVWELAVTCSDCEATNQGVKLDVA